MEKGKYWLSTFLLLVILTSSIYFVLNDNVRIDIGKTNTQYSVWDNGWVLAATEYVYLYDGTTKMRAKSRNLFYWNDTEFAYVTRTSIWKDNITTVQTYTFDIYNKDVEQFPEENKFECTNCEGKFIQFEIRDILYNGETKNIISPFSFGHNMEIEWEEKNDFSWAKVYQNKVASDKIIVKFKADESYEEYFVRLYDPPAPVTTLINPKNNIFSINLSYLFNSSFTDDIGLENTTLYIWNSSGDLITNPEAGTVDLITSADSQVYNISPTTNYGSSTLIVAGHRNDSGTLRTYRGLYKFDLSDIPIGALITSANLNLTANDNFFGNPANTGIYQVTNDSWTEDGVNWDNQPTPGTLISYQSTLYQVGTYTYDVTAFVSSQFDVGTNISFSQKIIDETIDRGIRWKTKENAGTKPTLTINYGENTYEISGTSNSSSINYTFTNLGSYIWNQNTCDEAGNCAFATENYTLNIVDNPPPIVSLNSPVNNSIETSQYVIFNTTVTDDRLVQNVSLYINGVLNQTNNSNFNGTYIFNVSIQETNNNWSILSYDNDSHSTQSETRFFIVQGIILTLNGSTLNIDAELNSSINVTATIGFGNISIDVDHPDYGDNYVTGVLSVSFDLIIDYFRKILFSGDTSAQELNYSVGIGTDENKTFNLSAHQYDEIDSVSVNITGTNNPLGVAFYKANSTEYDRVFFGNLTSDGYIQQDKLLDKGFTPNGYNKTQNISFDNEGTKFLYFLLDNNAQLVSFLLNVSSVSSGFLFTDTFDTDNYVDSILSNASYNGFIRPGFTETAEFEYDNFTNPSINTTRWSSVTTGSVFGYDQTSTSSILGGTLYSDVTLAVQACCGVDDCDGDLQNFKISNLTEINLYAIDGVSFELQFLSSYRETSDDETKSNLKCDEDTNIRVGNTIIWQPFDYGCLTPSGGTCDVDITTPETLSFNLTRQIANTWNVKISGSESSISFRDDTCGNYVIITNWTNGIRSSVFESCADTNQSINNDFNITINPSFQVLYLETAIDASYEDPACYGCDNIESWTKLDNVNYTHPNYLNNTWYYSTSIFDSSYDVPSVTPTLQWFTSLLSGRPNATLTFEFSGDNGDNYQNFISGVDTPIINPGRSMKWRTYIETGENGYTMNIPVIYSAQFQAEQSNLSNVTFDFGNDGIIDYTINGDFIPDNGTVQINLSTANITSEFFTGSATVGQTYDVPLVVGSDSAGTLAVEWIDLIYNPNPVILNYTAIQNYLTNYGLGFTIIPMILEASGINAIVSLTDLRFDYAGGNSTFEIFAHGDLTEDTVGFCYQESTNTSNQTGIDGDCSLDYSGSYITTGTWSVSQTQDLTFDGNFSTFGAPLDVEINTVILYTNYTKPSGALNTSLWKVSDGALVNYTIPSDCWNQNPLQVRAGVSAQDPPRRLAQCWNGGSWTVLDDNDISTKFYEEAMWWNATVTPSYYATNTTLNLTYYYSRWDYEWVPSGVEWIWFGPKKPIENNTTPYGQSDTTPILNITNYGYGGKNATLSILQDDIIDCVDTTISLDNNKSNGFLITENWTDLTNLTYLETADIYLWADYNCTYSTWYLFQPNYYFRQCVDGGTCDTSLI